MDNKGFISVEYLFSLFIVLIIALGVLFYASASISTGLNIEDSVMHRMILDEVADVISQVNSNGEGYSKYIKLPSDKGYFEITVQRNELTIKKKKKKGQSQLILADFNSEYKLVSGRGYVISKTSDGIVIT